MSAQIGTINFFDTHIGAWEDHVDGPAIHDRFRSVIARLVDHRGFRMHQDASVPKTIRKCYYQGRKGDLEVRAECTGRTFNFVFFQSLNVENPYGGRHDFNKFGRMPRPMQFACVVEMCHVLRKLVELGYVVDGRHGLSRIDPLSVLRHAQGRTDEGDPLGTFNIAWRADRFARDESGWPTAESVGAVGAKDRDGLPVEAGSIMFCRDRGGRLFRGVARPTPNEQWVLLGPSGTSARTWSTKALFRSADREPRRFVPGQRDRVLKELQDELKKKNFDRVEALARVAGALEGVAAKKGGV